MFATIVVRAAADGLLAQVIVIPNGWGDDEMNNALGRLVSSEVDGDRNAGIPIVRTALNTAVSRGLAPQELLQSVYVGGKRVLVGYGKQNAREDYGEGVRWAGTSKPATARSLAVVKEALAMPWASDPTLGATSFFEPGLQDKLAGRVAGYKKTAADIVAEYESSGHTIVRIPAAPRWLFATKLRRRK
jgi:hypothetical protein